MSIKVALEHRTSYTFDRLVRVYPHIVRLRPAPHSRTSIEAYSLRIEPADHFINWQQDALGNFLARLVFPNPMRQLRITVGLIADLKVINPFDFFIEDWAEIWPCAGMAYPKALADDLRPYLRPVDEDGDGSGPGELTQAWVRNFTVPDGTRTIDFLVALNRAINADVGYCVRMEPGVQTPDFTLRTGVRRCAGTTRMHFPKSLAQQHFPRSACVLNRRVIATIVGWFTAIGQMRVAPRRCGVINLTYLYPATRYCLGLA